MPKRIAITIAGAVSLGSYEAGVLYELLRAIRLYNEGCNNEDGKLYVDVLTGASAGGMTAAMVSQRLMYDTKGLEGEFSNVLYQAWVKRISLLGLAKLGWKEKKWNSLFSSDLIGRIGEDLLVEAMKKPCSGAHAAVEKVNGVPEVLRVGLALTNLEGIDYMIPIAGNDDGGFNYTSSADQKLFEVKADGQSDADNWKTLCSAAVGSGAFPVAFRPKAVDHKVEDYGEPRLPEETLKRELGKTYIDWRGDTPRPFPHSDGGVLQNQPLGIAKNLVDAAVADRALRLGDAAQCDSSDRLYVFVAPHSVKSSAEAGLHADKITIAGVLKELFNVYMRQSTFRDWISAEGVNQKIRLLDLRAGQLADVISREIINPLDLDKAASDLNVLLIPKDRANRIARLREQYSVQYKQVSDAVSPAAADAFVNAIAALEAAANLESQDKMKIFAVIAAPEELAGSGLAAFVGFFKESFREHDYWVGRTKTRKYLSRTDVKGILGVAEWPEQGDWKKNPLQDRSGVKLPLSTLSLVRAGFLPAAIMVLIRPILLVPILLLLLGFALGVWHLFHL